MRPTPSRCGPGAWVAEGLGTALMMLGGLTGVALCARWFPDDQSVRLLFIGMLFGGCVTLVALSPLGRRSGAHLNPAVTIAFWALGRLPRADMAPYLAVQLIGALAGSLAFRALWGTEVTGVTHLDVPIAAGLGLELAMTVLLMVDHPGDRELRAGRRLAGDRGAHLAGLAVHRHESQSGALRGARARVLRPR